MKQYGRARKFKGFTLIELLVVIAVLGILATVLLVNLRGARDHGINGNIISQMSSLSVEGQIYYQQNGNYVGICGTGHHFSEIRNRINSIAEHSTFCSTSSGNQVWKTYIQLNGTPNRYFCVDSLGNAREYASLPGGAVCP